MERQRWLDGTLYSSDFEQDSCGFGLIAQLDNQPSHTLVQNAIGSLACMTHRGAIAADGLSGDGCGLLFKKPDAFLKAVALDAGMTLAPLYAAGLVFLSREAAPQDHARATLKAELEAQGLSVAGFRVVPTNSTVCGESALASLPHIEQVFVNAPGGLDEDGFERKLYIARRRAEKALAPNDPVFYLPTLSCRVIGYKGLVMPDKLPVFYPDLNDARFTSSLAVFHQRFSTNTWPQWRLAQPFRYLAHNGEINTVQGNRNWSRAREQKFATPMIPDMDDVRPIVGTNGSDSMSLDNMVEGLVMGGAGLFRALRLVIPPAWQNVESMDADIRAFYEYNSMHMEPWDGPAGIVLTDGRYGVCTLDRNGLRPARWVLTKDRILTIASEVGVWKIDPANVDKKGRVKPGQMIAADLETGRLLLPADIDNELKGRHPYREWLKKHARMLELSMQPGCRSAADGRRQPAHAPEALQRELRGTRPDHPRAGRGRPGSHRLDGRRHADGGALAESAFAFRLSAPAVRPGDQSADRSDPRSDRDVAEHQFRPRAQPVRGDSRTCAPAGSAYAAALRGGLRRDSRTRAIRFWRPQRIDLHYDPAAATLQAAIETLTNNAVAAVRAGKVILVLSDRNIDKDRLPIHALFAVGAVHHALIAAGLRCNANIVVETGTVRDPHHYACLIGYGATAVYPYLAYQIVGEFVKSGEIKPPLDRALSNFRKGMDKGLYKVLSKMGISLVSSYRGAQLFEARRLE